MQPVQRTAEFSPRPASVLPQSDSCKRRLARVPNRFSRSCFARESRLLPDGGLAAQAGNLSAADLDQLGLAKREISELLDKLSPAVTPDFDLDPSKAKSAQWFADEFQKAVPRVDKAPE